MIDVSCPLSDMPTFVPIRPVISIGPLPDMHLA
jgi:hypothetical protein